VRIRTIDNAIEHLDILVFILSTLIIEYINTWYNHVLHNLDEKYFFMLRTWFFNSNYIWHYRI